MAGLTINEEREEYVTFSDPYYKASQRLVTLADDTAFDDCKDAASVEEVLKGLSASDKIGGQQGTTAQYFVEGSDDWGFEGVPAEWVPYKSASLAVQDMINGNVKYVIIDAAPAESITKAINAMQKKYWKHRSEKRGQDTVRSRFLTVLEHGRKRCVFAIWRYYGKLREQMEQVCTDIY